MFGVYPRGLRALAFATVAMLVAGFALVFYYAPLDADQGFIQKIFYLHVPLATTALVGFVVAAVFAIRHLRSGDSADDARSYVAIHLSVIFGVAVLATGAIWARASWGKWWVWDEPTLTSFLIVFLLYCTYYPLRYSIEDRDRQARVEFAVGERQKVITGELDELDAQAFRVPRGELEHPGSNVRADEPAGTLRAQGPQVASGPGPELEDGPS